MDTLALLQHYWWFLISLLGALLVFLLFVQGGQSLLYTIGRTEHERNLIVNSLGRKWELTFTTLVTFGGAFFASFPLFYSTSFGGAFYVWMLILLVFVLQAVSYEYRRKPNNVFGEKTFDWFLKINGFLGTILLGAAVGTFFTGANFTVDRFNMANLGGDTTISQWTTPWHGLEAVLDYRNVALGLAVLFLSRMRISRSSGFTKSLRKSIIADAGAPLLHERHRRHTDPRTLAPPLALRRRNIPRVFPRIPRKPALRPGLECRSGDGNHRSGTV